MSWFDKKKKQKKDPNKDIIDDIGVWEAGSGNMAKTASEYLEQAIESAKADYRGEVLDSLPNHFVQYVVDSPATLRSYLHGLNIGKHVTMTVLANIVSQIAEEMGEGLQDSTLENIKYSISKGYLPIYNDHYDSELCSVLYNGIMPNGEIIDIDASSPEELSKYKKRITDHLSIQDPVPTPITPEYLELRMSQYNNFFNVTCDVCGTPHGFLKDVPDENFKCTLCDNELVIYTNHTFKEDPYEE